jgi:aryl-alcohol dehydrogenase-like predicted oxidoreductase
MALTDYVTLGRSGLRVSPFCLGAMTFGEDWGWGSSVAESGGIISRFMERGGNFIDTANVYTKGHSEKIIGDVIGRDRATRDRVVIATKFFGNLFPAIPTAAGPGERRLSRRASSRCAACRPITSISTGCTAGIGSRPSTRRCARWTIS